jgi:hypothetical protein
MSDYSQYFVGAAVVTTTKEGAFVTEASNLHLPPGVFPKRLETELGNQCDFNFIRDFHDDDGTFLGAVYSQAFGVQRLYVLND